MRPPAPPPLPRPQHQVYTVIEDHGYNFVPYVAGFARKGCLEYVGDVWSGEQYCSGRDDGKN